ncbi:MAG: choice-of-anchor K domain-containing protein, partial [Verrucomicrobiales bacterium]|nr:choice-of-anchor K domain-containing protein [Verrucomicrobiales bacterium]
MDTSFVPEDLDIAGGDVVNTIAITEGAVPGGTPPPDPGLVGGHFDLDTSSFIASIGNGTTDGHVHEYDDKYDTAGADFFNLLDNKLDNITDNITDPNAKFKIIAANADLSPGARIVINSDYDALDPSTFVTLRDYDDIPLASLPIYSLSGVGGTTKLEKFALYFETYAIPNGRLVPTNTGDVRDNVPGLNGEWRNGSVTVQAVEVNSDGSDNFGTDLTRSAGGAHGVATSGLYWEAVAFWHWHGVSYHENPDYVPNLAMGQEMIHFNTDGSTDHLFSGFTEGWFSNPTGDQNLVTSLGSGQTSNEFGWGSPASGFATGNYLRFDGANFEDVPTDVTFLLGMLEYYNSTTYLGTNATGVEFDLEVSIVNPNIDVPFDFDFSLLSTPNYSYQTADQNADYVWIGDLNSDFSAWMEGVEFGLALQFGEVLENGFATIDTFHVHEGATAQGFLFGELFVKQLEPFKIVVGGDFESYGSHTAKNLVRLMPNGTYDSEFNTTKGAMGVVNDLVVQPNGMIVIVGDFTKYDGRGRKRVARVDLDGSRDNSFNVGRGANKEVYTVSLYGDGKIFIGGEFKNFNKRKRRGVARLHANGKIDKSYNPGTGNAIPSWRIYTSSIGADEKVVVGGLLTAYNPLSRSAFKRLGFDGTIDDTFNPPDLPQGSIVYGVASRPGGEVLAVGDFDYSQVIEELNDIAKINTGSGALDESFYPGSGTNEGASVTAVDVLSDGSVIVGGSFTSMDGELHDRLAKLSGSGAVDSGFVASIQKTEVGAGALEIDFEDFGNFDLKHGQIIDDLFESEFGLSISANNALNCHPDIAVLFDTNERHTADADLESPWSGGNIAQRLPDGLLTDFGHALIIGENDWDEDGDGYIDSPDDEAYGGSITFSLDRSDVIGFQATFIDFEETDQYSIYLTEDELESAVVDFSEFIDPSSLWYDPFIALGDNFVNILPTIWADDTGLDYFSEITVEFPGSGALDQLFFITDENWTENGMGNTPALVSCISVDDQDRILVGGDFNLVNGSTRKNIARLNSNGTLDHSFSIGSG